MASLINEPAAKPGRSAQLIGLLSRFLNSAPFAYATIVLLQLRAIWGVWNSKDVTSGDTFSYFVASISWFRDFKVEILWSPLYTAFFGSFLYINSDPAWVVLMHRLVIVFAATLLVLTVSRRLLPPPVAWLVAAWWSVMPINFDTLYEVHLFAVLPILLSWWLLSYSRRWASGAALAVLAASTVLVRNELGVPAIVLGFVLLVHEWRALRSSSVALGWQALRLLGAYGLPLALASILCLSAYERSTIKYPELNDAIKAKNAWVLGQWFAVGYHQRHPEWRGHNPWLEWQPVMREHFGKEMPTLGEMFRSNPRAVLGHYAWNWSVAPNGIEALLFNSVIGKRLPADVKVPRLPRTVLLLCLMVVGCWLGAVVALVRNWRYWWQTWLAPRALSWTGMLAVVTAVPLIISNVHPRPAYLFGLGVFLMTGTGMALFILSRRFWLTSLLSRWVQPVAAAVLLMLAPQHYLTDAPASRPVFDVLKRLQPLGDVLRSPDTVFQGGVYAQPAWAYLGWGKSRCVDYDVMRHDWPAEVPLEKFLASNRVNVLYLDEPTLRWIYRHRSQEARSFLAEAPPAGWRYLASGDGPGDRWRLYQLVATSQP